MPFVTTYNNNNKKNEKDKAIKSTSGANVQSVAEELEKEKEQRYPIVLNGPPQITMIIPF